MSDDADDVGGVVIHLVTPPPQADARRREAVSILRDLLARAEQGEFSQVAFMAYRFDGTYFIQHSATLDALIFKGMCSLFQDHLFRMMAATAYRPTPQR